MSEPLDSANFDFTNIKYIFTDIDDTLTSHGQLQANAYKALWDLKDAGFKIIPVTGRPAGWCEMIVRFWPVNAVIGENGGFYFCFKGPEKNKKLYREFVNTAEERTANQQKLKKIETEVLKQVPGSALASDQFTRLMDLAIDFCEDVPALTDSDVQKIVSIYEQHGAVAKVSSIHVNGWFGDYSKISMIKTYCQKELGENFDEIKKQSIFVGDSPNDEPSFEHFKTSVGVANISKFLKQLKFKPTFITKSEGGDGFVELTNRLIK
jgi:HAD superfamily hydrolase (TIGR01484 family)